MKTHIEVLQKSLPIISALLLLSGCAQITTTDISHNNASLVKEWEATLSPDGFIVFPDGERTPIKNHLRWKTNRPNLKKGGYVGYVGFPRADPIAALARVVTEKMISSAEVQSWATEIKKPVLIVTTPHVTTAVSNIITEDLQLEIGGKVLGSELCLVGTERTTLKWDYILKTTITSTIQGGDAGSELTYYTCKLQLLSLNGEQMIK